MKSAPLLARLLDCLLWVILLPGIGASFVLGLLAWLALQLACMCNPFLQFRGKIVARFEPRRIFSDLNTQARDPKNL